MPQSNTQVHSCRHESSTSPHTDHVGKKIWRMLKQTLSRSPSPTSPILCPACTETQRREKRMQDFVERKQRPLSTANPLREARCAPPARGVNQTLMTLMLGEDESSIQALKTAQEAVVKKAGILELTRNQQEAVLEQTRQELQKTEEYWRGVHASHEGQVHFDPVHSFDHFAGPKECRLCRAHRDALVHAKLRRRDHFVQDEFDPRIHPEDLEMEPGTALPESAVRAPTRRGADGEERGPKQVFSNAKFRQPQPRTQRSSIVEALDEMIRRDGWVDSEECEKSEEDSESEDSSQDQEVSEGETEVDQEICPSSFLPSPSPSSSLRHPTPPTNEEPVYHETDHSPSDQLLSTTSTNGSVFINHILHFLSLSPNTTIDEMARLPITRDVLLGKRLQDDLESPFLPSPSTNFANLPPRIHRTKPHDHRRPRVYEHLQIRASAPTVQARRECAGMMNRLSAPQVPASPSISTSDTEVTAWEADESIWDDIEDAPNTRLRIIRTTPTRMEVLAYLESQLRKLFEDRVPRMRLSPLRNETVVEDDVSDDEEF